MKKYQAGLFFLIISLNGYTQSQVNDTVILDKTETSIIAPQYKLGYKFFCKNVADLYRGLNIIFDKGTGYSSSFEITINRYGKIISSKYLAGTKNIFNKIKDTLDIWSSHLSAWKPAYDVAKKLSVENYVLTIHVFINTDYNAKDISVIIEGRKKRTLHRYSAKY